MAYNPAQIVYCTSSKFKREEWEILGRKIKLEGREAAEIFDIQFRDVPMEEPLLCDLAAMVRAKCLSAYEAVLVPCIVEHAGIILDGFEQESFPGGLTQPMWDALGPNKFVEMCKPLALIAKARAVIGYCDGANITVFSGDTTGTLKERPFGSREFYWDTVFAPDGGGGKTYAEIVGEGGAGLARKMEISQSAIAFEKFLNHRFRNPPDLFS